MLRKVGDIAPLATVRNSPRAHAWPLARLYAQSLVHPSLQGSRARAQPGFRPQRSPNWQPCETRSSCSTPQPQAAAAARPRPLGMCTAIQPPALLGSSFFFASRVQVGCKAVAGKVLVFPVSRIRNPGLSQSLSGRKLPPSPVGRSHMPHMCTSPGPRACNPIAKFGCEEQARCRTIKPARSNSSGMYVTPSVRILARLWWNGPHITWA
ncbi:hypothetical protein BKA62DRAFT_274842 [Auriculariales sp. MPI-PUGE-AT-0066]|nr:hypothetical protein BKA62DRAFT_274842 [Auriculariales sp. MPI-PUGE-AT-0066]